MTGSLRSNSSIEYVPVGRIGPPHGLDGTVYVQPDTDDPHRFVPGSRLIVAGRQMSVQKIRPHPDRLLVKFAGISDRVSAQKLRGLEVFIEEHQRRTLDSQEFWPDQLEGLEARTPSGEVVGRVTEVEYAAVQQRLVIETESGPRQVPFVDELVPSVNLEEGYLTLADIPGLL